MREDYNAKIADELEARKLREFVDDLSRLYMDAGDLEKLVNRVRREAKDLGFRLIESTDAGQ
ncbi:hypothetical protein [Glycomyces xiaoerkulensis]|uniref:hypothetical protein n=1 Tax=Glycomyces xiaoerkulensis TaxID=2038139 RepID=UPI001300077F|nr:hypothetical protein [Glycomyces xiaoerkulensis]